MLNPGSGVSSDIVLVAERIVIADVKRVLLIIIGLTSLAIGAVGIFVPLLPTHRLCWFPRSHSLIHRTDCINGCSTTMFLGH